MLEFKFRIKYHQILLYSVSLRTFTLSLVSWVWRGIMWQTSCLLSFMMIEINRNPLKILLFCLYDKAAKNGWQCIVEIIGSQVLPDTWNCGLRMRRECWEHFPRHRLQRKPLVSNPCMHHGTYVTHVPWCTSGSLTRDGEENAPGIPGACATRNITYLARGSWLEIQHEP